MLHLQGDLQSVFDVLYALGIIEPVLKKDWREGLEAIEGGSPKLESAIEIVNLCKGDNRRLQDELAKLDKYSLEVLAMEVAREYTDFHTRTSLQ